MARYETIISTFESLVDDTLDSVLEGTLMNEAKDNLEAERDWEYLKDLDETQTFNSGDTYLTLHSLPSDFRLPSSRGIFIGSDVIPYLLVPFEDRLRWQSITHRYYIKLVSNQYAICGSANPGGVIHFHYQKASPTLAAAGNPLFPSRFDPILAFLMAMKYYAIDGGEKSRAWDDRWQVFYQKLHDEMVLWDEMIKYQANQNAKVPVDLYKYPNIVDIDQP